jgi:mono/diheme cytochrome c family protein
MMGVAMMIRSMTLIAPMLLAASAAAFTYEPPPEMAKLRPGSGPGFEAAQNHCGACHSADYIEMQPPHQGTLFWEKEVAKMVLVFKAQIPAEDMKGIAEYLAEHY